MKSKHEMSDGRAALVEILELRPPESTEWNEAQNRFKFIDRLLLECLGWQAPDINVEQSDGDGGRLDYELGSPIKAVLEAKKEILCFGDLPAGSKSKVRKLKPLLEASKELHDAFTQCITYCVMKGSQLGIVCNGPQLLVFQAFGQQGSPFDGEGYFFNGFKSYVDDFPLLWKILSPEGIEENRAHRDISLHRSPRIPPKALDSIPDPRRHRYRDDFQENIRTLSTLLLDEIEDNSEIRKSFYSDCYVPVEANNRHTLLSKQIIANRYKRVSHTGIVPKALKLNTSQKHDESLFSDPSLGKRFVSRPIVVLGDVGVGKTSFFENLFFEIEANEHQDTMFIHINLGQKASLALDLRVFVIAEIVRVLRTSYSININEERFAKSVHYEELKAFDESPNGKLKELNLSEYQLRRIDFLNSLIEDRAKHLLSSLGHLCHGRNKQIIVIIDNADQRNFETQQSAFLIAQELAAGGSCLVFVALRPSTFHDSKKSGALSGYQNKVFAISPPPVDEVIQKRLSFAMRVAEGKQQLAALDGIRFQLNGIVHFLRTTLRSIRSNQDIQVFLGNITGGNTRATIELVTSFFGSPNVDSEKIIRIEEETGRYQVPLHEFSKHALLGEYSYYNPLSSVYACNVFDVSISDPREHFLKPIIVSMLYSNSGLTNRDGFVLGEAILTEMLKLGFDEDQCRHSIRKLARNRLVETPYSHYRELSVDEGIFPEAFSYRVTSIGIYHVKKWISTFSFLDAVSIDTPIFDEQIRARVHEIAGSFSIGHRLEKAKIFRKYLESQWQTSGIGLSYFDFSELVKQQEFSFDQVEQIVRKQKKW